MAEDCYALPTPWVEAESSPDRLQDYLNSLYWEGVTREIQNVIISLNKLESVTSITEEDDIMKRLPAEAAFFVEPWGMFPQDGRSRNGFLTPWQHHGSSMITNGMVFGSALPHSWRVSHTSLP